MSERRKVLVVDEAPIERWDLYSHIQAEGVPLEILPRMTIALPRALRLAGGVMLVPEWDVHWGAPEEGLAAAAEDWLATRDVADQWMVLTWTQSRQGGSPAESVSFAGNPQGLTFLLEDALRKVGRKARKNR